MAGLVARVAVPMVVEAGVVIWAVKEAAEDWVAVEEGKATATVKVVMVAAAEVLAAGGGSGAEGAVMAVTAAEQGGLVRTVARVDWVVAAMVGADAVAKAAQMGFLVGVVN